MRAQLELNQVVGLIFVAAAALILIVFWSRWSASSSLKGEVDACRLSVENAALLWLDAPDVLSDDFHIVNIDCRRRNILFTPKDVKLNGKRMKYFDPPTGKTRKSYHELTPDIINSVIASELATCWYEFLEGKMYFMNRIDIKNNWVSCFLCSEIHFDPSLDPKKIGTADLLTYLATHQSRPYPRKIGGTVPTFKQYLYLGDSLCDHSGASAYGYTKWFVFGKEWYDPADGRSCQEQFYEKILVGEHGVRYPSGGYTPLMYYLNPDHTPGSPPYEGISVEKSYLILFFQLGSDRDKTDDKKPSGTTYAPIIIPTDAFGKTLVCENYLG